MTCAVCSILAAEKLKPLEGPLDAHVKELLEQTTDKLQAVCPEVDFGVYSAGLRRRDTEHPVIVAGIQSVYQTRKVPFQAAKNIRFECSAFVPLLFRTQEREVKAKRCEAEKCVAGKVFLPHMFLPSVSGAR